MKVVNSIVKDLSAEAPGIGGSVFETVGVDVTMSGRDRKGPGVPQPQLVMQTITSKPIAARRAVIGRTSARDSVTGTGGRRIPHHDDPRNPWLADTSHPVVEGSLG